MLHTFSKTINQLGLRFLIKMLALMIVLVGFAYLVSSVDFEGFFKSLPFTDAENAGWLNGKFAYLVLASLLVSIGCPRQVISFFAAFFFGLWMGIVIGVLATTLACMISFFIARVFQDTFKDMLKGKLKLALDFWKENTFFATMIWRFIPAGSNLLTNLAAGAFGLSALPFILGSAVGYIPHTVIFALLGAGVEVGSNFQIIASAVLLVISIIIGVFLLKKYRKQVS